MPNRILRDWTDSARFDGITADAERLFVRLIMKADDYGRFHARPQLVKSACFPLAEDLRSNTVAAWLTELSDRQLVFRYTSGTGNYLAISNFGQRLKMSRAKFPQPPGKPDDWLPVSEDFRELPGTSGNFPPESETETETDTETPKPPRGAGVAGDPLEVPERLKTQPFMKAWATWQTFRRGLGKKPKDWVLLFRTQLDWLEPFGPQVASEILNKSIRNGWQGLFDPNENRNGNRTTGARPSVADERNRFIGGPEGDSPDIPFD